jgi:hypothetical protein
MLRELSDELLRREAMLHWRTFRGVTFDLNHTQRAVGLKATDEVFKIRLALINVMPDVHDEHAIYGGGGEGGAVVAHVSRLSVLEPLFFDALAHPAHHLWLGVERKDAPCCAHSAREVRHKVACACAEVSDAHPLADPTSLEHLRGALLLITLRALPARREARRLKAVVVRWLVPLSVVALFVLALLMLMRLHVVLFFMMMRLSVARLCSACWLSRLGERRACDRANKTRRERERLKRRYRQNLEHKDLTGCGSTRCRAHSLCNRAPEKAQIAKTLDFSKEPRALQRCQGLV